MGEEKKQTNFGERRKKTLCGFDGKRSGREIRAPALFKSEKEGTFSLCNI